MDLRRWNVLQTLWDNLDHKRIDCFGIMNHLLQESENSKKTFTEVCGKKITGGAGVVLGT